MILLIRLSNAYHRYLNRKVDRIMRALYPELDDRASAYACMAAETAEASLFGEGDVLGALTVVPDEVEGYHVLVQSREEVNSDI